MRASLSTNQKGFSPVEGLLIFVIVGLIGFVGWYVMDSKDTTNKQLDKVAEQDFSIQVNKEAGTKAVELKEADITKLKETPTKTTPITNNNDKPANNELPPPPVANPGVTHELPSDNTYSITISSDGCMVAGRSTAGHKLIVGAYSDKKGGSVEYEFTAFEIINKPSGGYKGMTAFGQIVSPEGIVRANAYWPISADSCPAAG